MHFSKKLNTKLYLLFLNRIQEASMNEVAGVLGFERSPARSPLLID